MTPEKLFPRTRTIACPADPAGIVCGIEIAVPILYSKRRGYRPPVYDVTGTGRCPEGHLIAVGGTYIPPGPPVAREVGGGLPGMGKRR